MLNWDEPLTPQISRPPEAAMDSSVPSVEPAVVTVTRETAREITRETAREIKSADEITPVALTPATAKPINPEDKRVVNGHADINQLAPFKYPWAWEYFLKIGRASCRERV